MQRGRGLTQMVATMGNCCLHCLRGRQHRRRMAAHKTRFAGVAACKQHPSVIGADLFQKQSLLGHGRYTAAGVGSSRCQSRCLGSHKWYHMPEQGGGWQEKVPATGGKHVW
jgi:hypothetical protein